jgi:hypothetical protein
VGTGGSLGNGSSGGSSPRAWERPFKAGAWEAVDDPAELLEEGLRGLPPDLRANPKVKAFMEKELGGKIAQNLADGFRHFINGPYSIMIKQRSDGTISEKVLDLVKRRVELLHEKFPIVAKSLSIVVTRNSIMNSPNTLGATLLSRVDDYTNTMWLREDTLESNNEIRYAARSAFFQNSDKGIGIGDWVVTHEWGHASDKRLDTPEPPELFRSWLNQPYGVGLSEYGRTSPEEAYAESFADWFTSGGKTQNPATLAYAVFHGWEVP